MAYKLLDIDPYLTPYEEDIKLRMNLYRSTKKRLLGGTSTLVDFANGHKYFGFHRTETGWVYREWAPAADAMYLRGDFNNWEMFSHSMTALPGGVYELHLEGSDALKPGQKIQAIVVHNGQNLERIPLYATRVVQDPVTYAWCAEVEDPDEEFSWTDSAFCPAKTPFIYECHIGMSSEEYKVNTYREFTRDMLPHISRLGYNTIQIMAIMEHPYYGSFGYQVSNFFAPASRYGYGRDLKELINTAHSLGITVLLDVVHSHAVKNTCEGINEFDGTTYQFFHDGEKGEHSAWGTKCFNYGKDEVLHFLLSNLKYWMEEFHFDGFRFDGVTSMLYHDHGLGTAFDNYGKYFSLNTDCEAVTYLQLANELIHGVNPRAITIAEDMSGMPGMCIKIGNGGIGFDYRLSMGVPDLWIRLLKEQSDEFWDMYKIWYELTGRRPKEKNIGYAESHDQALVGDKTIMFRLCDAEMYTHMSKSSPSMVIDRGMALHKMILLLTASVAGEGYLNFMGNEFGHPEWIDFPREGNGWSYHYCRRQWSLAENPDLRYGDLERFDVAMIALLKNKHLLTKPTESLWIGGNEQTLIYRKGAYIFAFNFSPTNSYENCFIPTHQKGRYSVILSTDAPEFGGQGRISTEYEYHSASNKDGDYGFACYLPARTAVVFRNIPKITSATR